MDHLLLHYQFAYALWSEIFFRVWDPVGDAEDSCFSPFCMEEFVGKAPVKDLEYGFGVSNVVSLAGMRTRTFEDK